MGLVEARKEKEGGRQHHNDEQKRTNKQNKFKNKRPTDSSTLLTLVAGKDIKYCCSITVDS